MHFSDSPRSNENQSLNIAFDFTLTHRLPLFPQLHMPRAAAIILYHSVSVLVCFGISRFMTFHWRHLSPVDVLSSD